MLTDAEKFVNSLPRCTYEENNKPCTNIALFLHEGKEVCFFHLPEEKQVEYRKRYRGVWLHG